MGAARTSGVDDMDWRRRRDSRIQISTERGDNSISRVEIQQDGTMAVGVPEMSVESIEPSDKRVALISADT
ncbi:hypothetical protein NDU88_005203 [Pleurodeles waltl]|uniref:Uncharacterized protein n=1 Tax=Pleurodeles waltl TaxID=8319 RepID=A0AAV7QE51_PLEWA|nr:hypothetical protein NDU88_005203 [Pleurodeles waltl]